MAEPSPVAPDGLARWSAEVVVVGLGASGLEAVGRLADRGLDVIGLDARGVAAGAAGANGGFLLAGLADFHHDAVRRLGRPTALGWWRRTCAELDRIAATEPSVDRVGSLRIAASADELADCSRQLTAMQSDGLAVEAYDGPEGQGILVHGDGVVDPVARCRRLAHRAQAAGARLVAPAPVDVIEVTTTGAAVHLGPDDAAGTPVQQRSVTARAVLVAVDGGLDRLRLRTAAGVVPLVSGVRTARLQMLATAAEHRVSLPRPVYRRHGLDYVQQRASGEVLLGGGRDVGGDEEWADRGALPDPSPQVQAHLDRWLAALGVAAPVVRRWAAHAAFTTDRLPLVADPAPGVHVVGAYSGHGNVLGGLLAREAADRITEDLSRPRRR